MYSHRGNRCNNDVQNGTRRDGEEVNVWSGIGRLVHDPELKYTPTGTPMVKFRVAVNRNKDEADFINCIAFNKVAENLANYQRKGNRIGIVGKIQTGSYENQEGKRIYTFDVLANNIEFLESRSEQQNGQNSMPNYQSNTNSQPQQQTQNNAYTGGQNQPFGNSEQFNQQQNNSNPFTGGNVPPIDDDSLPF